MTREEVNVEFTGLAHDHLMINRQDVLQSALNNHKKNRDFPLNGCYLLSEQPQKHQQYQNHHNNHQHETIQIGDSKLVSSDAESDYSLSKSPGSPANGASALSTIAILRRHPMYDSLVLVKRFRSCLNGYSLEFPTTDLNHEPQQQQQDCCKTKLVSVYLDGDDPIYQCQEKKNGKNGFIAPEGEVVYVPMNGLLDRLENYYRHGVSIDSRVYAFAMGLKTAEKFLTSSSMKEIQETPPL